MTRKELDKATAILKGLIEKTEGMKELENYGWGDLTKTESKN